MKKPHAYALLLLSMIPLMACGAGFESLCMEPQTDMPADTPFHLVLMDHMALQRDLAFARDFRARLYLMRGVLRSKDGNHTIYVLENTGIQGLSMRYAYIYIQLMDSPYLEAHRNTSLLDKVSGFTSEADAQYKGMYRLSLMNARLCYGETRNLPAIIGNEVRLKTYNRILRVSMYDEMASHYTPTICQGAAEDRLPGAPPGVRFYFETPDALSCFAAALRREFPAIATRPAE